MRVPATQYRRSDTSARQRLDPHAICVIGAALLLGGLVWVLAIVKVIELFRFH
jgi:hypothetical protein